MAGAAGEFQWVEAPTDVAGNLANDRRLGDEPDDAHPLPATAQERIDLASVQESIEKRCIGEALRLSDGNETWAAQLLNITRELAREASDAGIDGILPKPLRTEELESVPLRLTGRRGGGSQVFLESIK